MELTLKSQLFNFFVSFVWGIVFSIFFDITKIFDIILDKKSGNIRDFAYFFIYGIFSFILSLAINNGDFSFYIILGELLGWFTWRGTLSKKILKMIEKLINKIKKPFTQFLKNKVIIPLRLFNNKIKNTLRNKKSEATKITKFRKNKRNTKKCRKKFFSKILKINKTSGNKI